MSKCRYDLSEDCNNTDCLNCVLDKISEEVWAEIEDLNILNDFSKAIDEGMEKGLFKAVHIIDKYRMEVRNE